MRSVGSIFHATSLSLVGNQIKQSIEAKERTLAVGSEWGGLSVKGKVVLLVLTKDIVSEEVKWEVLKAEKLPPAYISLPSLEE